MKRKLINIALFGIILFPLILWLLWVLKPSNRINILIMDKTVLTPIGFEHRALAWVLHHQKYFKPNGDYYSTPRDISGFFRLKMTAS